MKKRRPAPPGAGSARARARAELKKRAQGAQRVNPLLRAERRAKRAKSVSDAVAATPPTSNHVQERRRTAVARPAEMKMIGLSVKTRATPENESSSSLQQSSERCARDAASCVQPA